MKSFRIHISTIKSVVCALVGWLSYLDCCPVHQKLQVRLLIRALT